MSFQADGVYQIKNRINENKSTPRDVTKKLQKKIKYKGKKILKVAQEKRYLATKKLHLNWLKASH